MSGPKAHRYRVTSAEEIRRREDAARHARCESLARKCRTEAEKLESPDTVAIPSLVRNSHEGLLEWETDLNNALRGISLQQDKENAKRIVKRLRSNMPDLDVAAVTLGKRSGQHGHGLGSKRGRIEEEVSTLVPLLGKVRNGQLASELLESLERLVGYSDEALAKGDLLTLKSQLNTLLSQQDMNDMALIEIGRIAHIEGAEADTLRRDAETVSTKEGLESISQRVSELLALDKARQDEAFVAKALEEILSDLGFEIEGGFDATDFGRVAIAESNAFPGYALRLQVNPKNGMLFTRMVSFEAHDAETDASVERESCESIAALRDRLENKGIEVECTSRRAPGERPIELLDGAAVAARLGRRRRQGAERMMPDARQ